MEQARYCMGLTEPDAGSNTLNTKTNARKKGDKWIISGTKTFISGADRAKGMLIVARTKPVKGDYKNTLGLSLFLTDLPHPAIEVKPILKHGINYSHSCEVSISELELSEDALMPTQDMGWYSLLDTLNTETMSFTAAAIGIARLAISKAVEYSNQRKMIALFDIFPYYFASRLLFFK